MSDLVGIPEDRFSHNEAHFIWCLQLWRLACVLSGLKLEVGFSRDEVHLNVKTIVSKTSFFSMTSTFKF